MTSDNAQPSPMKSNLRSRLLALALAALCSAAQAGIVEARFGATDGLGIGLASGDA